MRDQFRRQRADLVATETAIEGKVGPARQINGDLGAALVHRQQKTVAADTDLVTQRLTQRFAYRQRAVLHRVMLIDVQIAAASNSQLKAGVLGELLKHVIKEAD